MRSGRAREQLPPHVFLGESLMAREEFPDRFGEFPQPLDCLSTGRVPLPRRLPTGTHLQESSITREVRDDGWQSGGLGPA